jgi:phosphate transport system protein
MHASVFERNRRKNTDAEGVMMSLHLQREIGLLKKRVLSLCALVESQVEKAVRAVVQRDELLASEVRHTDDEIDQREIEVEEECLKILALHQPVAVDLRMIIAVLKINNDLERMGDLAVNIARKARALAADAPLEVRFDIAQMCAKSQLMVHDSIDALVNLDTQLAQSVCDRDDEIDRMKSEGRLEIEQAIRRDPGRTDPYLRLLGALRNLERIADCATNIAEDVIYVAEGKIVRHRRP